MHPQAYDYDYQKMRNFSLSNSIKDDKPRAQISLSNY